jgi:hypothetical protein
VLLGGVPRAVLPGERGAAARLRVRLYLRGPLRAEAALGDPRTPRPPLPGAPAAPAPPAAATAPAPAGPDAAPDDERETAA